MQNTKPLVSIIMPAYNASRYIAGSIQSVLHQTYANWELLVVNDGSTDDTGQIINRISESRIRYFEQQNSGASAARNLALEEMKGQFFCFLDADDQLPDYSLELRVQSLLKSPEVDLLDGGVMIMDENMDETINVYWPSHYGKIAHLFIRVDDNYFFGPNLMIRNKGTMYRFKEGMTHAEDLWFYTELSWKGNLKYGHINDVIYHYRKSRGSATSNFAGIEKGYLEYYHNVSELPGITSGQLKYLKNRIKRIMFRSYLGKRNFLKALSVLFKF